MRRRRGPMMNQSGQAILEYIFLVFIAIIVIAGLVYQFNGSVRAYFNEYFTNYLSCMIENGVLPGDDSGVCTAPTWNPPAYKVSGSIPPVPAGGAAGSGAGGAGAGAGGRAIETNPGIVPLSGADGAYGAAKGAAGAKGADKKSGANTGDDGFSSVATSSFLDDGGDDSFESTRGMVPYTGEGGQAKVKKQNPPVPATARDLKTAREIAAERLKKAHGHVEDAKLFTIGNIFRYMIIFLIFFAIVFFIGSQLMAVSRGGRKR